MKTNVELLEILLKEVESKPEMLYGGLCLVAGWLKSTKFFLTCDEEDKLIAIIQENQPVGTGWNRTDYFWKPFERQPRIDFLKQLIKKLKAQEKLHGTEQD